MTGAERMAKHRAARRVVAAAAAACRRGSVMTLADYMAIPTAEEMLGALGTMDDVPLGTMEDVPTMEFPPHRGRPRRR
jgi:hypothetical protein